MQNIEEIARKERNAYFRNWRSKNKDKVRAINKRYWEKKAKKVQEKNCKKEMEENKNDK